MLINCDVKSLEVVVAAELSGDSVLRQEIIDKVDIHGSNRVAFNLGEGKAGRLVAKIFKFRLIYGGTDYSYAQDPAFTHVSTSPKFWRNVIDRYYTKYTGVYNWHNRLLKQVKESGIITVPSGRYYQYEPFERRGELVWPLTTIKNWPVQGFGADLVMLARIELQRRLRESKLDALFIQTVHDSLVVDTPEKNCYNISVMCNASVETVPALCQKHFNYNFSLPLTSEIKIGLNKKDLQEYTL